MIMMHRYLAVILILISQGALCENFVSLAYDDGGMEDAVKMDGIRGHSVLFTAPYDNWTLSRVAIYGKLTPKPISDPFIIEVWDDDLDQVSKVTDDAVLIFGNEFEWVLVDIPDVNVSRDFFVSFYEFEGIYTGIDRDSGSGRSLITAGDPNRVLEWDIELPQNETNWMIRAVGHSPPPKIGLEVLSDSASPDSPAMIEAKIKDPDHNLKSALLYVVNNKSREVVWSDFKALDGGEKEVQFFWSGTMYQVSNGRTSIAPVFVTDNDVPDLGYGAYLNISALCLLQLEPDAPQIYAFAYFGDDGRFNALVDYLGFAHYISQDVLNIASHDVDYMNYKKGNITLVKDKSRLIFYKMVVPPVQDPYLASHRPVVLSKSVLFNYRLELEEVSADPGDYLVVVEVEDRASNIVIEKGEAGVYII